MGLWLARTKGGDTHSGHDSDCHSQDEGEQGTGVPTRLYLCCSMNWLASPLGILRQLAQDGLGRCVLFWLACGLGRTASVILSHAWEVMIGRSRLFEDDFSVHLGSAMFVVPLHMIPEPWEIFAFTLCAPLLYACIRFEMSLRWLMVPFFIWLSAPWFKGFLWVD